MCERIYVREGVERESRGVNLRWGIKQSRSGGEGGGAPVGIPPPRYLLQ